MARYTTLPFYYLYIRQIIGHFHKQDSQFLKTQQNNTDIFYDLNTVLCPLLDTI